ncbi:MAG: hypothetical protein J6Y40_01500, partial [Bacteroidales bacterium]|nr:hypothetical protein [Bacteroidales bacterium]
FIINGKHMNNALKEELKDSLTVAYFATVQVEEEQQGKQRAEYGSGFGVRQLNLCRQFYRLYPIGHTLCAQLGFPDKSKTLDYLRISAPIAEAQDNQELLTAVKIIEGFENPQIP